MNDSQLGVAWALLSLVVVEALLPLQLLVAGLFVGVGYILYLLLPLNINIWSALLGITVLLPLAPLTLQARGSRSTFGSVDAGGKSLDRACVIECPMPLTVRIAWSIKWRPAEARFASRTRASCLQPKHSAADCRVPVDQG